MLPAKCGNIKLMIKYFGFLWRSICADIFFLRRFIKTPYRLVLIRHAESERNKALDGALFLKDPTQFEAVGKVPDHKISITERGWLQAKDTSKSLYKIFGRPHKIFHSGYLRTRQTTEGITSDFPRKHRLNIEEDLTIREREAGYTHTLLQSEAERDFPYLQAYWDVVGGLFARPVGGESLMDVVEHRLKHMMDKLNRNHRGQTVFLVTHGRVIQCLRFLLDDMSWDQMEHFLSSPESIPENCGVTTYQYDPMIGKLKLQRWNQVLWD